MCDACLNNIYCSQNRFQCTECYDYDLCLSCFRSGRESKSHKSSHAIRHILKTEVLKPDDFIPPHDDVNPEQSADQLKTFITLEPDVNRPESEMRWHFLHGADSHLRYLTATVEPGHYAAHLTILTRLSGLLNQAGLDDLKEEGLGYLRVGLGTLRNKKQFFRTRYQEESFASLVLEEGQMIDKMLDRYWWTVVKLPGDGEPVVLHADCVFSLETPEDLGLIVQWSGIRAFASGNEATVSINVADIRLYDIRDFTEPLKVPPEQPPTVASPQPPIATPAPAPEAPVPTPPTQAADAGDEEITAEELLSALLQIQQSVEDARQRAQLEAAIKQRLKQQEEERQTAVFNYMFAKAIQEQAILEQERQEQEEARRFLRLMGFNI
ncbi:uncharacterized protein N0V89_007847 [Didymosphaeria variabile]|uniref:ZZ-type domain-containing protein n=1 Tax=Didymosphaeria variabile TaxID=1932322 RepID=A0A9W8XK58_9PLEO|nr:uncharacterized protein N0V89_007847 [Didymosphaeria variabile]KAJ4352499.1 hypothetical protein N0V89_007847 [Didymosphaeria variabile]